MYFDIWSLAVVYKEYLSWAPSWWWCFFQTERIGAVRTLDPKADELVGAIDLDLKKDKFESYLPYLKKKIVYLPNYITKLQAQLRATVQPMSYLLANHGSKVSTATW